MTAIAWESVPPPAEIIRLNGPGTKVFVSRASKCSVIINHDTGTGWHLSISHPWRYPTWEEIKAARYTLVPDAVRMTMHLPPSSKFVNVHPNCFHLFECRCAVQPP